MARLTRRSAEAQESVPNQAENVPDVSIARTFLGVLNGLHLPQNEWFIIPNKTMNCTTYPVYESGRVLSKMIGIDGAAFVEALFQGKSGKQSKEAFLVEQFRVMVHTHRGAVTFINFCPSATFFPNAPLQPVPDFSQDAIAAAKGALLSAEDDASIQTIVHDFVRNLESSARQFKWHLCVLRQTIEGVTGWQVDENVCEDYERFVAHTPKDMRSSLAITDIDTDSDTDTGSSTADDLGQEQTICQFIEKCSDGNDSSPLTINNSTTEDQPNLSGTMRLLTYESADESSTSSNESVGRRTVKAVKTPFRRLLREKFPHKSNETVKQLNNNSNLEWKQIQKRFSKKKYIADSSVHVRALLHAVSSQDPLRAAQIINFIVESDLCLQATTRDELQHIFGRLDTSSIDTKIVNCLSEFKTALHSNGTRPKADQQAIDALITAVLYSADVKVAQKIRERIGISYAASQKASDRVKLSGVDKKLHYHHYSRSIRKDNKRKASLKYVQKWCHDDEFGRVAKVDTGEFKFVHIKDKNGVIDKHPVRRWIDAATQDDLYSAWNVSEFAADFKKDHPDLRTIGKTVFWENVCRCCRFGKKDMCSDQIMSGLEEARDAMEKALNDSELWKAILSCQCKYHMDEQKRAPIVKCVVILTARMKMHAKQTFNSLNVQNYPTVVMIAIVMLKVLVMMIAVGVVLGNMQMIAGLVNFCANKVNP